MHLNMRPTTRPNTRPTDRPATRPATRPTARPTTRRTARLAAVALVGAGLFQVQAAQAATATYTLTNLGSLGYISTEGAGLDATGQATGVSSLPGTFPTTGCPPKHKPCLAHPAHAFRYSDGAITDLGTLGGEYSAGAAINASGTVAGYADLASGLQHAAVFSGGTISDLGSLSGAAGVSSATAINDAGQVAGSTTAPGISAQEAFIESGGVMTGLGILSGGTFSTATGINSAGAVVGIEDDAASDEHGFVYSDGVRTDLGSLGGPNTAAYAINDNGLIVGTSQTASDADHVFAYSDGTMTDLGGYNIDTVPQAVNDAGVIVGQTYGVTGSGSTFLDAFIYEAGAFHDLNSLIPAGSGWQLTDATAINAAGQILVDATETGNGQTATLLLTPTG